MFLSNYFISAQYLELFIRLFQNLSMSSVDQYEKVLRSLDFRCRNNASVNSLALEHSSEILPELGSCHDVQEEVDSMVENVQFLGDDS